LQKELRSGRARSISDEKVARLIRRTLRTKPKDGTHWSCRSLATETRLSKSTIHRIWRAFRLQPHRARHFHLSNDPFFVEKVRDIVGLYLNPPDKALVLCVDEKSQIQALQWSQPMLPLGLGYVEGITHNYFRHGTTTLFAAFDPITGTVLSQCKRRHRHQEFLDFLRHVDASVPKAFDGHLIVDNYATQKHPRVQRWLAARPRYHVHFTPPTLPGSTKWKSGSTSSRRRPFVGAPSVASKNLLPKSNLSSIVTMRRPDPSPGRPRPIPS
jgi:putative transposase